MDTMSSVVQVFDNKNKKLYEGESRDRADEYAYRLLMLGTHDFLTIRESGTKGARRSVLTREQANRRYDQERTFDDLKWGQIDTKPRRGATITLEQKIRARRYANLVTGTIFLGILIVTFQAMLGVLQ